ncbi:MAG TPA: helix-turn-helix transcriptional regulator [Amycolatopsis sp.]
MAGSFGETLRRIREEKGISQARLAKEITYSTGYLSKIENGLKAPTADIAKRCDSVLGTGGVLSVLVRPVVAAPDEAVDGDPDEEVWVVVMDGAREHRFHQIPRRQAAAGFGLSPGFALSGNARTEVDELTLDGLQASFGHYRRLGTMSGPAMVLVQVVSHLNVLRTLAAGDHPAHIRARLLLQASRAAEYAGWMSQETGDEQAALWWTRRAVRYATAGGDEHLASYAHVRQAEIALYRQDPLTTIALAARAQHDRAAGPRILGLAARCEAQGHALAGDHGAFERALDRAGELLAEREPGPSPLGSSSVSDEIALARGWSLVDLGRPAEAAEVLDRHVPGMAVDARRARARFGARRVLAHAAAGELDQACALARDVLEDAAHVDSATIRTDLRQLARVTARWHAHPAVRELRPVLSAALHLPPAGS